MQQQALLPEMKLDNLVAASIALLRAHEPEGGAYYGAFSGGKDSVVIKELARMAGVRVEWHYHNTTIDPPELVRFIREGHPDVIWDKPKHGNFFARMETKGFPTRRCRWCCAEYKEVAAPRGVTQVFGVRSAESPRRAAAWKPITWHNTTKAWVVAPALAWSEDDVWDFIDGTGVGYCSLYDEGFSRLGCIGCPMASASNTERDFERWPRFRALWRRGFQRVWDRRVGTYQENGLPWFGTDYFHNCEEMWLWWCSKDSLPDPLPGSVAWEIGRGLRVHQGEMNFEPDVSDDESDSCQIALDMLSGGGE